MQKIQLLLQPSHVPYWNVNVWYGPTRDPPEKLARDIEESFAHAFRRGDVNYSVHDMRWSKIDTDGAIGIEALFSVIVDLASVNDAQVDPETHPQPPIRQPIQQAPTTPRQPQRQ